MRGKCKAKEAISYCRYTKEEIEELELFCLPYEVNRTKKFASKGRVSIQTPSGNIAFEDNDVLLKLSQDKFVVLSKEDFEKIFEDVIGCN